MTVLLRQYPEYKDSCQPWIGAVPRHWDVLPNRALFKERIEKNHANEQMLSVTIGKGVISQRDLLRDTSKKDSSNQDKSNYKLVQSGDIAYNKMRAWQGAVGVSRLRGIISPAYVVQTLRMSSDNPEFFHYVLRTPAFAKEAERWSYGITSDQWSLRSSDFKQIYCQRPPRNEQDAIVQFLRHVDAIFNRLIRAKRSVIELLEEQKQVVIDNQISTSNVDADKRWTRLKYVADVQTGITLGKRYSEAVREYPYLRVANVQSGRVDLATVKKVAVSDSERASSTLRPGDVLMTEGGDIDKLGRGCVWKGEIPNCLHQNHVFAVRTKAELEPEFLVLVMMSQHGRSYFQSTAKRTTNLASTNQTTIRNFPFCLPSVEKQREILNLVRTKCTDLDLTILRAANEIALLGEYRTRLVTDVVTGKLDVRGVQLSEIEAVEEPEALADANGNEEESEDALVGVEEEADASN